MIEQAKKLKLPAQYDVIDIKEFNKQSISKYDAVISLFHVMSYQNSNNDIHQSFSAARRSLIKGGLFIFDCWYGPGVLCDLPSLRVKEVSNNEFDVIRIARPDMNANTNVVTVNYDIKILDNYRNEITTIKESHNMRYFFRPEMEEYLNEEGFELLDVLDCKKLCVPNYKSWTVYFVAVAV